MEQISKIRCFKCLGPMRIIERWAETRRTGFAQTVEVVTTRDRLRCVQCGHETTEVIGTKTRRLG